MSSISGNFIHDIIEKDLENNTYGKKVYTRFPPEPNGYLHIGHSKSICLNFLTAKKYGGKCNLRYDDTNPLKEEDEYVRSIEEDVRWLGFEWEERLWASNYFDVMYDSAVELIKKGKAYVCKLSPEEMKQFRGTLTEPGKDSPTRECSVEENLSLFENMKNGMYKDGEMVLRAKIDMSSPNINMRDPVIYRISHTPHHNTGDKWCIYPMYDFAHPIEDAIEGITHSICTLEFEDHRPFYDWTLREVGFWPNPPKQIEFAKLQLTNTIMSKRNLRKLVEEGICDGWDDPRMPTIAGLRRRGYTPESIRDFCDRIGVAKANSKVDIALLEHCLREDLKTKVHTKNIVFDPIKVVITNYPEDKVEYVDVENNKECEEFGTRKIAFGREIYIDGQDFLETPPNKFFRLFPGNEVRLKGAYFIKCNDVIKGEDGTIKELHCTYDEQTKSGSGFTGRKVKGTIHFVEASTAITINVNDYNHLAIEDENGEEIINPNSVEKKVAIAEASISETNSYDRLQFFRHGYYILDSKLTTETDMYFNRIVDLKSSWKG